jgi:predicted aldo/keto reductase-like oxidoreductase
MIYREYGRTGKKLSAVGFGGMRFKEIDNHERCVEMMVAAAEGGVNYFDTAPKYFGTRSEEVFGKGLAELRRRGLPYYASTKTFAADEAAVRREVEGQLKRMNLESIDFYHVWCITSLADWQKRRGQGILDTLVKLKGEGLIRHICVSSHLIGDEIKELLKEEVFEGVLFGYSAYNFAFRQQAFETIAARKLGCAVMNPLGGGIIPENPDIFDFIKTDSRESVVEAALHFLFAHEHITTALVGFGNLEQVREAVRAADTYKGIAAGEIERMKDALSDSFRDLCTGCQYCDNCPEGIPIPKLMDAYNQKLLQGSDKAALDRLKWHWVVDRAEAERCSECGQCEEACTQHLPIINRLAEILKIKA